MSELPFPRISTKEAVEGGYKPVFVATERPHISDRPLEQFEGKIVLQTNEVQDIRLNVDVPNERYDSCVTRVVGPLGEEQLVSTCECHEPDFDFKAEELQNAKNAKILFWLFVFVGASLALITFLCKN